MACDPAIQKRRAELSGEAKITLEAIRSLNQGSARDPWTDPGTLAQAVTSGVLDAPHLRNNPFGRGSIRTRIIQGACLAVDTDGHPISETERLDSIEVEARK